MVECGFSKINTHFLGKILALHSVLDNVSLIMMAAGDSTRFCDDFACKKQWIRVGEEPLWLVATRKITQQFSFKNILITASKNDFAYMVDMSPYQVVQGGDSRTQSLRNALQYVDTPFVLVSDVARWNTQDSVLRALFAKLEKIDESTACIVPYIKVSDTSFYNGEYLNRDEIKLIQTPQLSRTKDLRLALESSPDSSDESSAIHRLGKKIAFIKGSPLMNKLTFKSDLLFHLPYLKAPSKRVLIGSGIDVHSFEDNKEMWLGGVKIESPFGFKAHSDGDVALHALSDAILGAIGGGDIGQWFPDSNEAYKNADSKKLLGHIYDFALSVGYELHNVDISIMAQTPKIAPYKSQMRECIAQILHLPQSRVNIKATTTESLGFVGRKEGVCVQASVSMGFAPWQEILNGELNHHNLKGEND